MIPTAGGVPDFLQILCHGEIHRLLPVLGRVKASVGDHIHFGLVMIYIYAWMSTIVLRYKRCVPPWLWSETDTRIHVQTDRGRLVHHRPWSLHEEHFMIYVRDCFVPHHWSPVCKACCPSTPAMRLLRACSFVLY